MNSVRRTHKIIAIRSYATMNSSTRASSKHRTLSFKEEKDEILRKAGARIFLLILKAIPSLSGAFFIPYTTISLIWIHKKFRFHKNWIWYHKLSGWKNLQNKMKTKWNFLELLSCNWKQHFSLLFFFCFEWNFPFFPFFVNFIKHGETYRKWAYTLYTERCTHRPNAMVNRKTADQY